MEKQAPLYIFYLLGNEGLKFLDVLLNVLWHGVSWKTGQTIVDLCNQLTVGSSLEYFGCVITCKEEQIQPKVVVS